jgi:hypothetical protein
VRISLRSAPSIELPASAHLAVNQETRRWLHYQAFFEQYIDEYQ